MWNDNGNEVGMRYIALLNRSRIALNTQKNLLKTPVQCTVLALSACNNLNRSLVCCRSSIDTRLMLDSSLQWYRYNQNRIEFVYNFRPRRCVLHVVILRSFGRTSQNDQRSLPRCMKECEKRKGSGQNTSEKGVYLNEYSHLLTVVNCVIDLFHFNGHLNAICVAR